MHQVMVLNNDYSFMSFMSLKKALRLIYLGKAEPLAHSGTTNSFSGFMQTPLILRLLKLIRAVFKREVPYSKGGVFTRDDNTCQYCGKLTDMRNNKPTIDHIVPQSKGGKSTWDNCVCACKECNATKADKSLRESGMFLKRKPYQPTIAEFAMIKCKSLGLDAIISDLLGWC